MTANFVSHKLETLKILYVEDDLETREELDLILRLCVGELMNASNGREGLELYRKFAPHIVITDIQMPEMNGLTMAAEIKKINPDQAIVILSAYNDIEYLFRALELGIENYITKPIKVERLLDKLTEIGQQMNLEQNVKHHRKLLDQYKCLIDEQEMVFKFDATGCITYVNEHFCTLMNYSEAELIGQDYGKLCLTEEQQPVLKEIQQILAVTPKWQGVLKHKIKNNGLITLDATIIAIANEPGINDEYFALMVEKPISKYPFDRLGFEQNLNNAEQKHFYAEYSQALASATSQCILNNQGIIISTNDNFSDTLGFQTEELIGGSFSSLVANAPDLMSELTISFPELTNCSKILTLSTKNQHTKTLSCLFVPLKDSQGELSYWLVLSHNITEAINSSENYVNA